LRRLDNVAKMKHMDAQIRQKLIEFGIKKGDKLGAAVSGGVDSMVMLHCLRKLREEMGFFLSVFHMEHGIRGERSKDDMRFVISECEKMGVLCIAEKADIPALAKSRGLSVETAARIARYEFLEKQDADYIATAHHMDDLAETVIMNLSRGSGLAGLCGIPEKRGGIIRPMLDIPRGEIEKYAERHDIAYVRDDTNNDAAYTRNLVRLQIMPLLKKVNTRAAEHIAGTASILAQDEEALCCFAQKAGGVKATLGGAEIDLKVFLAQMPAIQKRILRRVFDTYFNLRDIGGVHIDAVINLALQGKSGKRLELGNGVFAAAVYGKLLFTRIEKKKQLYLEFAGAGSYDLGGNVIMCEEYDGEPVFIKGTEYFNAKAVLGAFFRNRKDGDFIRPLGMRGKKRLSDYLSDKKVPLHERDSLVLLAKGAEIMWVAGIGVSDTSKILKGGRLYKMTIGENTHA